MSANSLERKGQDMTREQVKSCINELEQNPNYKQTGAGTARGSNDKLPQFSTSKKTGKG